ncbi:MAG TPA: class I SAM-dependent methyltransferase [Candidatus Binatia bacterium]|jgi:SAM-dependent methyltransferase
MQPNQARIFAEFEGDRWFQRNQNALKCFDPETDLPLKVLKLYGLQPRNVLEIGAANGFRLAEIAKAYCAWAVAVEPSAEALRDGKKCFPAIEFVCGQSHSIPLQGGFDLIIVNFVLHWVDRYRLLQSVAEIDRLLIDGGFLIVGDFQPSSFLRVRYHHLQNEEVFTYKQDYGAPFLAAGIYRPICLLTGTHGAKALNGGGGENERTGLWLLQKSLQGRYSESQGPAR